MEKKVKLLPPRMPNFIILDMHSTNSSGEKMSIPVSELSREEAEEYGELMKRTFIEHHRRVNKRES